MIKGLFLPREAKGADFSFLFTDCQAQQMLGLTIAVNLYASGAARLYQCEANL
jgi:hypothetical protein